MGADRTTRERAATEQTPRRGEAAPREPQTACNRALTSGLSSSNPPSAALVRQVQRAAGNVAATTLVQRRPKKGTSRRERAAALGAPEARVVIGGQLGAVLPHLSAAQLQHVQDILDARAINPEAQARMAKIEREGRGDYTTRGHEKGEREENEILAGEVPIGPNDRAVSIDPMPLLTPEVFKPTVANEDETKFLEALRGRLQGGIWLLVGDGAFPQVWLSMSPQADFHETIPAPLGMLTRDALLNTGSIGAMHYRMMHLSAARQELDAFANRLGRSIIDAQLAYEDQQNVREDAFPGVVAVADKLGHARFPGREGFDAAEKLQLQALYLLAKDEVVAARPKLLAAAVIEAVANQKLADYQARTTAGAAVAVKWLGRAKVAGDIAGLILGGRAVLQLGLRYLAVEGAEGAIAESTAEAFTDQAAQVSPESEEAKKLVDEFFAEHPDAAAASGPAEVANPNPVRDPTQVPVSEEHYQELVEDMDPDVAGGKAELTPGPRGTKAGGDLGKTRGERRMNPGDYL